MIYLKNRFLGRSHTLLFAIALSIAFYACEGSKNPEEVVQGQVENEAQAAVYSSINAYADSLESLRDSLQKKGPLTVTRGDTTLEVTVRYINNEPVLINAQAADGSYVAQYFLKDRQLLSLRETGRNGSMVYAREFYYENDRPIATLEKKAASFDQLPDEVYRTYKPEKPESDFRTLPVEAYKSAMNFIMGR